MNCMSSPRSPRGSPRDGSPRGSPRGGAQNLHWKSCCWNWRCEELHPRPLPVKRAGTRSVVERREPLRNRFRRCCQAFCRRITRCPRCRCCVYTMPCCYCCAPDNMLNREVLMEQLKAAGGKAPSMNLVEETMAADAERMAHYKKKWSVAAVAAVFGLAGF